MRRSCDEGGTSWAGRVSGRHLVETGRVRAAAVNVPVLTGGRLRLDIASLDA